MTAWASTSPAAGSRRRLPTPRLRWQRLPKPKSARAFSPSRKKSSSTMRASERLLRQSDSRERPFHRAKFETRHGFDHQGHPAFRGWSFKTQLEIDTEILNFSDIKRIAEYASRYVGGVTSDPLSAGLMLSCQKPAISESCLMRRSGSQSNAKQGAGEQSTVLQSNAPHSAAMQRARDSSLEPPMGALGWDFHHSAEHSREVNSNAEQCTASQCTAPKGREVQSSAKQCVVTRWVSSLQPPAGVVGGYPPRQCRAAHSTAMQWNASHGNAMQSNAEQCFFINFNTGHLNHDT